ncbi:methyltransferase [Sorangium sp. So ce131]|uniref:methyltransferase n=1 Tax=Sorangium sp. So ce131 TaxID=3133282 RepID=UPI003F5F0092
MSTATPMSTANTMVRMLTAYWVSRALYTAAKLGVADAVRQLGDGAAVPVEQIARQLAVHPSALRRLLRALASAGVFREEGGPGGPRYGLSPLAEHLLSDAPCSLRNAALMYGEEMSLAWHDLPSAMKDELPSWDRALGVDHFGYYQQHPGPARIFDEAMKELGRAMYSDSAVAESYDFAGALGPGATVVDVGGGLGRLLACILQRDVSLRGILYDLPHVIDGARRFHEGSPGEAPLSARPEHLARLSFEAGNFFERVPDAADAYVLKRVLHDWPDDRCSALLANIARVMKPSGRVLVIEAVIPSGSEDHFGKWLDLNMMVVTGGRERTEAEFAALFEGAGLELAGVFGSPTALSVIEATKRPCPARGA